MLPWRRSEKGFTLAELVMERFHQVVGRLLPPRQFALGLSLHGLKGRLGEIQKGLVVPL